MKCGFRKYTIVITRIPENGQLYGGYVLLSKAITLLHNLMIKHKSTNSQEVTSEG